jgi:hypothetical protein
MSSVYNDYGEYWMETHAKPGKGRHMLFIPGQRTVSTVCE